MAKGRKPTPTELNRLIGNPSKRPMNDREPQFTAGVPHCPEWLDAEAKAIWHRVVPELAGCGLLTLADEGVLLGYCVAYGQLVQAERVIARDGITAETEKSIKVHPAVSVKSQALTQLRSFGSELGLSPVARTRLQTPASADDEFENWRKQTSA